MPDMLGSSIRDVRRKMQHCEWSWPKFWEWICEVIPDQKGIYIEKWATTYHVRFDNIEAYYSFINQRADWCSQNMFAIMYTTSDRMQYAGVEVIVEVPSET